MPLEDAWSGAENLVLHPILQPTSEKSILAGDPKSLKFRQCLLLVF